MDEVIPEAFVDVWNEAKIQIPDWPGFQRMYVDEETKESARKCREAEAEIWEAFTSDADEIDVVDNGDGLNSVSVVYNLNKEPKNRPWWTRLANWFRQMLK